MIKDPKAAEAMKKAAMKKKPTTKGKLMSLWSMGKGC